jgi:hypothetical protein
LDDVPSDKPKTKKTDKNKKKSTKKKKKNPVERSVAGQKTSGVKKKKKKKSPPTRPEATVSDVVPAMSEGVLLESETVGADIVLEEGSGRWNHLLDSLLEDDDRDSQFAMGSKGVIEDEDDARSNWNSRVFVPGEERSHPTDEDEDALSPRQRELALAPAGETSQECTTRTSVSKTKDTPKRESWAMGCNADSKGIYLPNNNRTSDSSPIPMSLETKPKRRSIFSKMWKKAHRLSDRN